MDSGLPTTLLFAGIISGTLASMCFLEHTRHATNLGSFLCLSPFTFSYPYWLTSLHTSRVNLMETSKLASPDHPDYNFNHCYSLAVLLSFLSILLINSYMLFNFLILFPVSLWLYINSTKKRCPCLFFIVKHLNSKDTALNIQTCEFWTKTYEPSVGKLF